MLLSCPGRGGRGAWGMWGHSRPLCTGTQAGRGLPAGLRGLTWWHPYWRAFWAWVLCKPHAACLLRISRCPLRSPTSCIPIPQIGELRLGLSRPRPRAWWSGARASSPDSGPGLWPSGPSCCCLRREGDEGARSWDARPRARGGDRVIVRLGGHVSEPRVSTRVGLRRPRENTCGAAPDAHGSVCAVTL